MTEERLRALEALYQSATEGPWAVGQIIVLDVNSKTRRCVYCDRGARLLKEFQENGVLKHWHFTEDHWHNVVSMATGLEVVGQYDYEDGGIASTPGDAAFIAESRTALPALLAEIRRLQEAVDHAIGDLVSMDPALETAHVRCALDYLRGALDGEEMS